MTERPEMRPVDEMAAKRTSLAFQRTRIAADRTLMAIIRTALSLIGFGFTIHSFFSNVLVQSEVVREEAPLRIGLALVGLGVILLALGIANHYQYMKELRYEREDFFARGLLIYRDNFPISLALVTAFLLLLIGLLAILSIIANVGPFDYDY